MTRVGAGLAVGRDAAAVAEAAHAARDELDGHAVDLAFVFLTPHHLEHAEAAVAAVRATLAPGHVLGCVAEGVIGREREIEGRGAAAVWAASLPGAELAPFHVGTVAGGGASDGLDDLPPLRRPALVALLVDPFTSPAATLLARLEEEYPGAPVVGGIATGGGAPGAQALVLDGDVHRRGTVGVAIAGVPVHAAVSQGCVPLGPEAVVTRADGNVVLELAGRPALERLREIVAALPPDQQLLAAKGLLAGIVVDENKPEYGRGDFLVRGILRADEETGAVTIGERVRTGQTLRLHARDAASADADLRLALGEALALGPHPAGALLFTCNGRGTNMFAEPDHDARALAAALGRPALAGFFCGGEIGPVGGRSFLHGFTATMALFGADNPGDPGGP